jgi:hypothetical protein
MAGAFSANPSLPARFPTPGTGFWDSIPQAERIELPFLLLPWPPKLEVASELAHVPWFWLLAWLLVFVMVYVLVLAILFVPLLYARRWFDKNSMFAWCMVAAPTLLLVLDISTGCLSLGQLLTSPIIAGAMLASWIGLVKVTGGAERLATLTSNEYVSAVLVMSIAAAVGLFLTSDAHTWIQTTVAQYI